MFWYEGSSFKAIVMANILSEHLNPHFPYIVTKDANNVTLFIYSTRSFKSPADLQQNFSPNSTIRVCLYGNPAGGRYRFLLGPKLRP